MQTRRVKKARAIRQGDTIGVIAPGSPVNPERFKLGLNEVSDRGFKVKCPLDPTVYYGKYEHGFASASARDRANAFNELMFDSEVSAILSVRGAYGSLDLLELIDFSLFNSVPKLLIGCSDITVLLMQMLARAGVSAIHGATLASSFADSKSQTDAKESVESLLEMMTNPAYSWNSVCQVLREGDSEGPIIAGNLSMFISLLGTPWDIDFSGAILVLEEVGEAPYRIHRMLLQLKLAGKLDNLGGLVFGRFSRCEAAHGPTVEEVFDLALSQMLSLTSYPVFHGLPSGHWGKNLPLPLGCSAKLSGGGEFRIIESPIE